MKYHSTGNWAEDLGNGIRTLLIAGVVCAVLAFIFLISTIALAIIVLV